MKAEIEKKIFVRLYELTFYNIQFIYDTNPKRTSWMSKKCPHFSKYNIFCEYSTNYDIKH